jgi:hypothetical protein
MTKEKCILCMYFRYVGSHECNYDIINDPTTTGIPTSFLS